MRPHDFSRKLRFQGNFVLLETEMSQGPPLGSRQKKAFLKESTSFKEAYAFAGFAGVRRG
ncbi:hypothetical protein BKH43_06755 [Helicobacter sp. 13S00401-1]|nr:hypothetical protein BKH43_06755 [Helicobacter sp. 13S00401-1]